MHARPPRSGYGAPCTIHYTLYAIRCTLYGALNAIRCTIWCTTHSGGGAGPAAALWPSAWDRSRIITHIASRLASRLLPIASQRAVPGCLFRRQVSAAALPSQMSSFLDSTFLDTHVGGQLPPSTSMQEVCAATAPGQTDRQIDRQILFGRTEASPHRRTAHCYPLRASAEIVLRYGLDHSVEAAETPAQLSECSASMFNRAWPFR